VTLHAAPNYSAIAERLLAHARLCEEIAAGCRDDKIAEKLRGMAQDCAQTAAQIASAEPADPAPGH
jgi:hypothetical protein